MTRGTANIEVIPVNPFEEGNKNVAVSLESRPHLENKEYIYDFGNRRRNGEEVAHMVDAHQFNQPQNVTATLRLPLEVCKVINYVEIKVNQSSEEHECNITDGGIGKSHIELQIIAKNTDWFNYDARFYAGSRFF